jgi:hypothetical protein
MRAFGAYLVPADPQRRRRGAERAVQLLRHDSEGEDCRALRWGLRADVDGLRRVEVGLTSGTDKTTTWGEKTDDEMCIAFLYLVSASGRVP